MLRTTGAAAAILILPCSGAAYAATWQTTTALPTTVEYDSNPVLATGKKQSVTRTIIAPDFDIVGTSDQDQLHIGLGLNVVHSSNTAVVRNREDPNLLLGWERETEKGAYGLTASYVESSTLSSQVQETGVVAPDGTQKQYTLGGNWRTALSERSTLVNETEYTDVKYDINTLTPYDELSNRLSWNYAWSDRVELFTRFSMRRYEPASGSGIASSNSYTPTTGFNYKISDRLEGGMYVGVNETSGTNSGPTGQGGFNLHYAGERFDTTFDASRSTIASGNGGFVESDNVRATWSYSIDELSRAGIDTSWQKTTGQTPNTLRNFNTWVSRELSPFWVARLSYTYKQREQDNVPNASANVVGLTLTYSYPEL
ncbi:hypothetical protein [Pseudomonas arsenicoxydans]|uniref:DUF560 domain-containing protein n=1 Tax=Pseudomonas arsenicoxydans TaxID=702115 RepID=A0A502HKR8_9PSED|nr:hypothetical protein [Pseudomonas arsenicoxydans]TPG75397.1 hypothetical protein EAH78_21325 [Pseudomonas arsenicoxydans]